MQKLMSSSPLFFLMGPTASGKTQLAVELVQRFPFEIISVDSAMVYREMNIGTSKPTPEILKIAPHHLIDIRDPAEIYSAAQFREDAFNVITMIQAKGKIPLLVGGTMLYFRALQQGLSDLPSGDPEVRARIYQQGIELGWPELHRYLHTIDPVAAQRIHMHDSQRIQRALEVYELTGKSLTDWQNENQAHPLHSSIYPFALNPPDRTLLHTRIAKRFDEMLALGLIEEVEHLFRRGDLSLELPSVRSVGYRQVWTYLLGELSRNEIREKAIIATRQLAKRQLTWLRSWENLYWSNSEAPDLVDQITLQIENLLKK